MKSLFFPIDHRTFMSLMNSSADFTFLFFILFLIGAYLVVTTPLPFNVTDIVRGSPLNSGYSTLIFKSAVKEL